VIRLVSFAFASAIGGAVLLSCATTTQSAGLFSIDWEDDRGASIAREWDRLAKATIGPAADVVIGVSKTRADTIVGRGLGGGPVWSLHHALDVRPIVAGSVVVASGGGEALAVDAANGSVLWRYPVGSLPLLGAGDDGAVTAMTFLLGGGQGSVLIAVGRDGKVVRRIETSRTLGAPAVVDGVAFVPWAGQYISAIDLRSGQEDARVTFREMISRAWTESGSLWFGESAFIRFDPHTREGSRRGESIARVPVRELPGIPRLMPPGTVPLSPRSSAEDRTRVYARPIKARDAELRLEDDRYYGTYFRLAIGFAAPSGKLAWVHRHPVDFVGGAAIEGGVALCDESGEVTEFDAKTGGIRWQLSLGEPVTSCVVNADSWVGVGDPKPVKPLSGQLADALLADDPQLVISQKVLLRELSASVDPGATDTLVRLASDPRTSQELVRSARTSLAARRNGAEYMIASLERHYDFLKDVLRPPPVGPIAHALGAMKVKAAAPLLVAHLFDPADTDDDVREAAATLVVLSSPAELPGLRQFFGMYRAASGDSDALSEAVVSVAQAMLEVGDRTARDEVEAAAVDANTVPMVAEHLQVLLASGSSSASATDAGASAKQNHR